MTRKLAHQSGVLETLRWSHEFVDDFIGFDAVDRWTVTADVGETQDSAVGSAGGQLSLACDGDDNDEAYAFLTCEPIVLAAGTLTVARFRFNYTEANTDDANIAVGIASEGGADFLVDNGGGPPADYTGAVLFKVDGGTAWQVEVSHGTAQTTKTTTLTPGGGVWEELEIAIDVPAIDLAEVTFHHGAAGAAMVPIKESGSSDRDPGIKIRKDFTTPLSMGIVLGVKAGGANTETLLVDYAAYSQTR